MTAFQALNILADIPHDGFNANLNPNTNSLYFGNRQNNHFMKIKVNVDNNLNKVTIFFYSNVNNGADFELTDTIVANIVNKNTLQFDRIINIH